MTLNGYTIEWREEADLPDYCGGCPFWWGADNYLPGISNPGTSGICNLRGMNKDLDHIPSDFMFNSIHKEQHDVIRKAAEKGKCQEGYNCKAFMDRASELKAKVEETIKSFK